MEVDGGVQHCEFNATELYTYKCLKWQILCYLYRYIDIDISVYITTMKKKEINGNRILKYLWIDSVDSYCLYNKLKAKISIILMSRNQYYSAVKSQELK